MKKYIYEIEKVCDGLWSYTILCRWESVGEDIVDYTTTRTKKQAIAEAIATTESLNALIN
jgi:hypothetical protein